MPARRIALVLAAILVVAGCGNHAGPRFSIQTHHLVRPVTTARLACVSQDCGPYAATIHWAGISIASQTGYYVYKDAEQVADVATATYTFHGIDCGTAFTVGIRAHNGSGGTSSLYTTSYTAPSCGGPSGPTNTTLPVITGTPTTTATVSYPQGAGTGTWTVPASQLSVTQGIWSDCGTGCTYTYQWQDCNSSGAACANTTYSGTTGLSGDPCSATFWCYVMNSAEATNSNTVRATVTAQASGGGMTTVYTTPTSVAATATNGSLAVPCALTHAAGVDGLSDLNNASCWGLHTGVTNSSGCTETQVLASTALSANTPECDSTRLQHVSGDVTLSTANTVYANKWVSGCINVNANGVILRNVIAASTDLCAGASGQAYQAGIINDGDGLAGNGTTRMALVDVTGDQMNIGSTTVGTENVSDDRGISSDNYVCLRCNSVRSEKDYGGYSDNLIIDSFAHDLDPYSNTGSVPNHTESIFMFAASNIDVEHTYASTPPRTIGITGAIMFGGQYAPGGSASWETLNNSYMEGPPGADYVGNDCANSHDIHVTNNAFSNLEGFGSYGFLATPGVGMIQSGNYVAESPGTPYSIGTSTGPTC